MYGMAPADYSMHGEPAGLARIDELLGLNMYTSTFNASPIVFGAMPSLHAGWATMQACFLNHLFPRAKVIWGAYVLWVWWATLYLQHHYAVDLIAGSMRTLALTTITISFANLSQSPAPSSISPASSSLPAPNPTRLSAGTTITWRLVPAPTKPTTTPLTIWARTTPPKMNGPSALHPAYPLAAVAPSLLSMMFNHYGHLLVILSRILPKSIRRIITRLMLKSKFER